MKKLKLWAGCLLVLLLLTLTTVAPTASAADKTKPEKKTQPVSIEADELYFSDKTGEMFARGNVVISQDQKRIFADLLRGNERQMEIWVDGAVRFSEPLTELSGMKLKYNYGSKFGVMQEVTGKCEDVYLSGRKAEFTEGKYTLYDSTATTCKMKGTPDFRITAGKVDIWPGDKLIAHDAKVWVKQTVLYSTPRYQTSLNNSELESSFPRMGYQKRDGVYISQHLPIPLSKNVYVYTDLAFYSKGGFRPIFGVVDYEKDYTMRLMAGFIRDGNDNWVRKEPEFSFAWKPHRIGKLPFQYNFNLIFGKWQGNNRHNDIRTSWHQDLNVYFTHDPIYFDAKKTWMLKLGAGLGYIHESYDDSTHTPFRYNIRLSKQISPVLNAWTAFNYTGQPNPVFAFGTPDVPKEGIAGLSWKVNNRTTLSYKISYDFMNKRVYDHYYTVRQSFHCWETEVTYRALKKELFWTFTIARW